MEKEIHVWRNDCSHVITHHAAFGETTEETFNRMASNIKNIPGIIKIELITYKRVIIPELTKTVVNI